MKIYIGADHAGVKLKTELIKYLEKKGYTVEDMGSYDSTVHDDYPIYAKKVAKKVQKSGKGILVCGSGTGMVMAANRFKGVRAVAPYDTYTAKMSRHDNDANVIAFRGRSFSHDRVKRMLSTWLKTPFSKIQRHKKRIGMLDEK